MKAMVLKKPQPVENNPLILENIPVPAPAGDEILIKIHYCGLCRTDLHVIEEELPWQGKPLIPGHQIVGIVEKNGSEAKRFRPGERVGVAWLNSTCGICKFCTGERENLCEKSTFTGYHVNGGYAEYTTIKENFAYPLPAGFSGEKAAPLLCAGIIGYRALKLSEIKPGGILGLYGFGSSAHIAIQIARYRNCEVFVFTRNKKHRELALKLGASWAGTSKDTPPAKTDSAIIFAPAGELIPHALEVMEKGGTLALAGIYMTPAPEMDYEKHLFYEKKIISVTASTRRDGEEFLEIAAQIPVKTETTLFNLEEVNRGLKLLKKSEINGAGVVKMM